jgi:LysM repeat protein
MAEISSEEKNAGQNGKSWVPVRVKKRLTDKEIRMAYTVAALMVPVLLLSAVYFAVTLHRLSGRMTEMSDYVGHVESRTYSLEKRQAEFHGQLVKIDGKVTELSNTPGLKDLDTLSPRVSLLEKQLSTIQVRQKVTPVRSRAVQADARDYYEIKQGDTLYQIARKHGLSTEELARMNGMQEDDLIIAGHRLTVSR